MSDKPAAPPGLAARGARLWRDQLALGPLGPAALVLLEEACRIADRLDRLDAQLGQSIASMEPLGDILQEARLQAGALKGLVSELRQAGATAAAPTSATAKRDELAERRRARLASAASS